MPQQNKIPLLEKDRIPWVVGLAILGLTALIASFYMGKTTRSLNDANFRIGQAEFVRGKVWIFHNGLEKKEALTRASYLTPLDSVETEENSEARLLLENTASVRLMPESLVLFERQDADEGFQDTLVLQRGEIKIEDAGRDGEFFVSKNGQKISATAYNQSALSKEPLKPKSSVLPPESQADLSDEEINNLLNAQVGNFRRCYQNMLQKTPDAKGEANLNFTIENNGRVGLIEISSVTIKSDDFKRCLTSVLERVQFRAFKGTPISTFYPIKFE